MYNWFAISKLIIFVPVFNIIARKTLLDYCKKYPEAENPLLQWYHELIRCEFKNLNELKIAYPDCSIVKNGRVVFNISGNKFRLVVRMVIEFKTIQVKWFGTHTEYDKINVSTIKYRKK